MRRELAALLILGLVVGAAGCGDQDKGAVKASQTDTVGIQPSPNTYTPPPAVQKEVEQLKDAVGDRPVTPATAKVPLDKMFDGNLAKGNVPDPGVVTAPSQAEMAAKARRTADLVNYKNGPIKGSGAGNQPKGNTLPPIPLADPRDASADSSIRGGGTAIVGYAAWLKDQFGETGKAFSRNFWGAKSSTAREGHQNPTRVTIHHTDSARQTMTVEETRKVVKGIQEFHQGPERGWGDIGYHFLVDGGGNVFEGRHADVMGAHVKYHNENNIGIANIGDYNRDNLTEPQKQTLKRLISFLALKYKTDPKQSGFIEGHHHFSQNDTDCPGKHLDAFLPELRRMVDEDTAAVIAKGGGKFLPILVTNDPKS